MRWPILFLLAVMAAASPAAAELRPPLEKQFFDYFLAACSDGLVAEAKARNMDATRADVVKGIGNYCSCTSQAVVSHLDAGEIIAFAINPTQEPVAEKMKPYFERCSGK